MKFVITIATILVHYSVFASSSPFNEEAFQKNVASGSLSVVGYHSPSCGSCKVQKPNLEAILNEQEFKNVSGFMADFGSTKDFRRGLEKPVRGPSTIVIYKGKMELARITGTTNLDDLREELREALKRGI